MEIEETPRKFTLEVNEDELTLIIEGLKTGNGYYNNLFDKSFMGKTEEMIKEMESRLDNSIKD